MKYQHIIYSERRQIERALNNKESIRKIGRKLERGVSAISNEIRLGKVKGVYKALGAERKADLRRKRSKRDCLKVAMDSELKKYILKEMEDDQSPEGISGRLKYVEKNIQYASTKAIYKFVYSVHGRQIEHHLYSKDVNKKGGPKRGKQRASDRTKKMIDKRSKKANERIEFGHFEGDFIESGKDGKGSLLVLLERKTRYPFIAYIEDRSTKCVNEKIASILKGTPVKSATLDNDLSFQKHEILSNLIESDVFFCHPFCSQEKGGVENRNKAIRRYIPKRTNMSLVKKEKIKDVEYILRNKYMKCLNFKTPQEAWDKEMIKWEKRQKNVNIKTIKKRLEAILLEK